MHSYYEHKVIFLQLCSMWKEIAEIIRDREFSKDEEQLIDIFDIQVHPFEIIIVKLVFM